MLMEDLKGQVSFYAELLFDLMRDHPAVLSTREVAFDMEYAARRASSEGFNFLCSDLPRFGKALEAGIETGTYVVPSGFKRSKRNPGLPAFMQDALRQVFDAQGELYSGLVWADVVNDVTQADVPQDQLPGRTACASRVDLERVAGVVAFVRQVSYFLDKLELPFAEELQETMVTSFVEMDQSLPDSEQDADFPEDLIATARYEIERLIGKVDLQAITPRHGPGSVATGEIGDQKWAFKRTYDGLSSVYGLTYFTVGGADEMADRWEWRSELVHLDGGCAKLVIVPKKYRKGRLISEEPLEYQYIQQGQKDVLVPALERRSNYRINFRDQRINAGLALESSLTREKATLDMKDASDLVSYVLAKALMPPRLWPQIEATRSPATALPNGSVLVLKKFAPMGSAICFPVESTIFWAIAVAAISLAKPGSRQWIRLNVYTYGDDLIVPREYARTVMDALEACHLKVNRQKSFVNGFFRESCGTDAYIGRNVTPTRCKKLFPAKNGGSLSPLLSYSELAHSLQEKGYLRAADRIYTHLEARLATRLPYGTRGCGYVCRLAQTYTEAVTRNLAQSALVKRRGPKVRLHKELQRYEVRAFRVISSKQDTELDGWQRLLRNLVQGCGDDPNRVSIRRDALSLRPRWCAL